LFPEIFASRNNIGLCKASNNKNATEQPIFIIFFHFTAYDNEFRNKTPTAVLYYFFKAFFVTRSVRDVFLRQHSAYDFCQNFPVLRVKFYLV
jgi:hypothetical protein